MAGKTSTCAGAGKQGIGPCSRIRQKGLNSGDIRGAKLPAARMLLAVAGRSEIARDYGALQICRPSACRR